MWKAAIITGINTEKSRGRAGPRRRSSRGPSPGRGRRDVIAYCRIGERSSHTWFVVTHQLGYGNVRNLRRLLDRVGQTGPGPDRAPRPTHFATRLKALAWEVAGIHRRAPFLGLLRMHIHAVTLRSSQIGCVSPKQRGMLASLVETGASTLSLNHSFHENCCDHRKSAEGRLRSAVEKFQGALTVATDASVLTTSEAVPEVTSNALATADGLSTETPSAAPDLVSRFLKSLGESPLQYALPILTLCGLAVFGLLRQAYAVFYDRLGASPSELGFGYGETLALSAAGVALTILVALPFVIALIMLVCARRRSHRLRLSGTQTTLLLTYVVLATTFDSVAEALRSEIRRPKAAGLGRCLRCGRHAGGLVHAAGPHRLRSQPGVRGPCRPRRQRAGQPRPSAASGTLPHCVAGTTAGWRRAPPKPLRALPGGRGRCRGLLRSQEPLDCASSHRLARRHVPGGGIMLNSIRDRVSSISRFPGSPRC